MQRKFEPRNVGEIRAALEFTRGCQVAAAKLLDLRPGQVKSAVHYHEELANFRTKSRVHERLPFRIEFQSPPDTLGLLRYWRLAEMVRRVDKDRLRAWLEAEIARVEAENRPPAPQSDLPPPPPGMRYARRKKGWKPRNPPVRSQASTESAAPHPSVAPH